MNFIIRQAKESDIQAVRQIEMKSYPDPWPRSLFYLMYGRAPDFFLVAEIMEIVVGYIVGEIEREDGSLIGHVMNVAVVEEWRRRGIGSALMDEMEKRFKEHGAISAYLEVRVDNSSAQELYLKRGYFKKGILRDYYHGEDGLAMEKLL